MVYFCHNLRYGNPKIGRCTPEYQSYSQDEGTYNVVSKVKDKDGF